MRRRNKRKSGRISQRNPPRENKRERERERLSVRLGPIKAPHGVAFTRVSTIRGVPRQEWAIKNIFGECQPRYFFSLSPAASVRSVQNGIFGSGEWWTLALDERAWEGKGIRLAISVTRKAVEYGVMIGW